MAILREAKAWRRERPANETRRSSDLTPEEQANAKAALRFLAKRHGSTGKLAKAMGATNGTVWEAVSKRGVVSAGIALRAARVAGVPLEDVLSGAWPVEGRVRGVDGANRCSSVKAALTASRRSPSRRLEAAPRRYPHPLGTQVGS